MLPAGRVWLGADRRRVFRPCPHPAGSRCRTDSPAWRADLFSQEGQGTLSRRAARGAQGRAGGCGEKTPATGVAGALCRAAGALRIAAGIRRQATATALQTGSQHHRSQGTGSGLRRDAPVRRAPVASLWCDSLDARLPLAEVPARTLPARHGFPAGRIEHVGGIAACRCDRLQHR